MPGGRCLQVDHGDAGAGSLDDRGFRRRHERAIAELFTSVLALCGEAGLVEVGVISVDRTKIRANASRGANRTYEKLVADILKEAEETDSLGGRVVGCDRGDALPEHLRTEEGCRQAFKAATNADGARLRALIIVLWRAGLRISEALDLAETDLDAARGAVTVRRGKGGRRREVGMDCWAWDQLTAYLEVPATVPVGALF